MFDNYLGTPFAREDVTVSSTPISLTAGTYFTATTKARMAVVTFEAQPVRYTRNGTTPNNGSTPPVGDVHAAGNDPVILIDRSALANFRVIKSGATDATMHVTYYA